MYALWRQVRKSRLLGRLVALYPKWEREHSTGGLRAPGNGGRGDARLHGRLGARLGQALEASLFYRLTEQTVDRILCAPLSDYALFLGGFVLSSAGARRLLLLERPAVSELLPMLLILTVILPVRGVKQSLPKVMEESLLLRFVKREDGAIHVRQTVKNSRGAGWRILLLAVSLGVLTVPWSASAVLLTLACAACLVWFFKSPERGAAFVIGAFPLLHLLPRPSLLLLGLALWIELAYLFKAALGRRAPTYSLPDLPVLLLAVSYLCAGLVGAGGRDGLFAGLGRTVGVLFWFPVRSLARRREILADCFFAITLAATVTSFFGVYQYFFGSLELKWVDAARFSDIGGRVVSTFQNPNVLAVYLLSALPICLVTCLFRGGSRVRRAVGGVALVSVLLCIVLTWTRAAWLAAPCVMLAVLLLYSPDAAAVTLLCTLPSMLFLPTLPGQIVNRLQSIGRPGDSSVCYRLYTWQGTIRMIAHHPWGIGTGEAAFLRLYPRFAVSGTESVPHTHHLFLQLSAELGIAGALTLCTLLLVLLLAFFYGLSRLRREERAVLLAAGGGVLGGVILGLFDYIWYSPSMMLPFFFSAAILCSQTEQGPWEEEWK